MPYVDLKHVLLLKMASSNQEYNKPFLYHAKLNAYRLGVEQSPNSARTTRRVPSRRSHSCLVLDIRDLRRLSFEYVP